MVASSLQCLCSLASDSIDIQIFFVEIASCDQLYDVGIISTRKSPVRGNHNHGFLLGIAGGQIRVIDIAASCEHGTHRLIHIIEIRIGLLCTVLGFL